MIKIEFSGNTNRLVGAPTSCLNHSNILSATDSKVTTVLSLEAFFSGLDRSTWKMSLTLEAGKISFCSESKAYTVFLEKMEPVVALQPDEKLALDWKIFSQYSRALHHAQFFGNAAFGKVNFNQDAIAIFKPTLATLQAVLNQVDSMFDCMERQDIHLYEEKIYNVAKERNLLVRMGEAFFGLQAVLPPKCKSGPYVATYLNSSDGTNELEFLKGPHRFFAPVMADGYRHAFSGPVDTPKLGTSLLSGRPYSLSKHAAESELLHLIALLRNDMGGNRVARKRLEDLVKALLPAYIEMDVCPKEIETIQQLLLGNRSSDAS